MIIVVSGSGTSKVILTVDRGHDFHDLVVAMFVTVVYIVCKSNQAYKASVGISWCIRQLFHDVL